MNVIATEIPEVLIIEPAVFGDDRGFFFESFNREAWRREADLQTDFVQDNHSRSCKGVLRGLHYQIRQPQGKLVRTIVGEVFDVAVDIRKGSATFGHWVGVTLSADNKRQFWVPEGFAHGFLVLSDIAEVLYKATDFYAPDQERCIVWNDPDLSIRWPLDVEPILSGKDLAGSLLGDAEAFDL